MAARRYPAFIYWLGTMGAAFFALPAVHSESAGCSK
jgi:hypothetical protein